MPEPCGAENRAVSVNSVSKGWRLKIGLAFMSSSNVMIHESESAWVKNRPRPFWRILFPAALVGVVFGMLEIRRWPPFVPVGRPAQGGEISDLSAGRAGGSPRGVDSKSSRGRRSGRRGRSDCFSNKIPVGRMVVLRAPSYAIANCRARRIAPSMDSGCVVRW